MVHRFFVVTANAWMAEAIRVLTNDRIAELRFPEKSVRLQ